MNKMRFKCFAGTISLLIILSTHSSVQAEDCFLGQGTMSGEVTQSSALIQTRLTATTTLDDNGDLPGAFGVVGFQWSVDPDFAGASQTPLREARPEHDFVVRERLEGLAPNIEVFYRAVYGQSPDQLESGPICSFKTLPGATSSVPVKFIVGSCMNYNKFMHGKGGNADGPLTAGPKDKESGYPAFEAMRRKNVDFFVGTGDIVYYDNPRRVAETVEELRLCWHEQFRFPRMIAFFSKVPAYWSKDDHDFRFNDSDNGSIRLPLPQTGIELFREQLPLVASGDLQSPSYRTHRINHDLQIWLTEGRDYRSPNKMADGPEKSLWGPEQREWLRSTLLASDAKYKIIVTPTPMVGPDDARKKDNHANLGGFRHEADQFFEWLRDHNQTNVMTICGDRHWQYHSIHPSGFNEFACGALNDENARMGVLPGSKKGTDPQALIDQPYTSPEPSGGFLVVSIKDELQFEFCDDEGNVLYTVTR